MKISTVIFDFGGVISSPLFVGIGAFEEAEGYPKGSLLRLLFGDTAYIGVEGRAVADAVAADPDAAEKEGEVENEPDWHLLEKGQLDIATYFERMVEKAPRVIGQPIDMDAYGRFWRQTTPIQTRRGTSSSRSCSCGPVTGRSFVSPKTVRNGQ